MHGNPRAVIKPDGTFRLASVVAGIWDIGVEPIPPGGYLKAMLLGDQDVLTEEMAIGPETSAPLKIVLSTRGAVVEGTVVREEDRPVPRALVVLAPEGRFTGVLSFYRVSPADETGHFEMKGLTPGRYRLYAFEELNPNAIQDPGFLKPFTSQGEPLELTEGARASRRLRLITPRQP